MCGPLVSVASLVYVSSQNLQHPSKLAVRALQKLSRAPGVSTDMTTISTSASHRLVRSLGLAAALTFAATFTFAQSNQPPAEDGPDPALVNLAPADETPQQPLSPATSPASDPQDYLQQTPAPIVRSAPKPAAPPADALAPDSYNAPAPATDSEEDTQVAAGEDALDDADISADQPPPPLPDYDQPPAPADDYLWTPGYWAYAPAGYYWVPGVWVYPPYYGALWTPPYWGFYGGRYRWHPGYWGAHVGFYGGVNYGYGYIGVGYFGGYWNGNHFFYNRNITNVSGSVTNVYSHSVVYNNHQYGPRPTSNISYNGGRGGIDVAPRPAELAAMHEAHTPALSGQVRLHHTAAQNPQAAFNANRGQVPSNLAVRPNPIGANRTISPSQSSFQARGNVQMQRTPGEPARQTQQVQPQLQRAQPQNQPQIRPAPQSRPEPQSRPAPQFHPAPAPRPAESRPAPAAPHEGKH